MLEASLLLTADKNLPPRRTPFQPSKPERWSTRELDTLSEDQLAQRRIWSYRLAGPAKIEDLDILHREMNDMPMHVCTSIDWGPVIVTVTGGNRLELPLTDDYLLRRYY